VFGPKPHLYDFKLNRKVKDLAKMSALTYKAKENAIVVVEDINFDAPKTKTFMNILNAVKAGDKKIMFITPEYNDAIYKSIRNVPSVLGVLLSDVNTYDIVNSEVLVLTEGAAKIFAGNEEAEVAA
jgi:large subunit ribosomal protein L4